MADFPNKIIEIRQSTDLWGPYVFLFTTCSSEDANDGALPYGSTLNSVTVKAYVGNFKSSSDPDDFTEISDVLLDPDAAPTIEDNTEVKVWFQYPGETYSGEKVTLEFTITTATGATHPFYFQYVKVA